ncbi:MAG: hypothetical protein IJK47_07710 [Lachnospiraceae bacterium]|nr:hypothetical protein [Lachnospiraceae bacterium]
MRTKAFATWISLTIIVISILIFVLGIICSNSIVVNVAYGVLGSSIVSFVISITEYFTAKRESLTMIYQEAMRIVQRSRLCSYNYITEIDKKMAELHWKDYISHVLYSTKEVVPECKELIDNIIELNHLPKPDSIDYQQLYKTFIDEFTRRNNELIRIMKRYISFSDTDLLPLENAYGNISFICDIKHRKEWLYTYVYKPIKDLFRDLSRISGHLSNYVEQEENNDPVAYGYLWQAMQLLYKVEYHKNQIIAYSHFYDTMSNQLEELRCSIYHEEYQESVVEPIARHFNYAGFHSTKATDPPLPHDEKQERTNNKA